MRTRLFQLSESFDGEVDVFLPFVAIERQEDHLILKGLVFVRLLLFLSFSIPLEFVLRKIDGWIQHVRLYVTQSLEGLSEDARGEFAVNQYLVGRTFHLYLY